MMYATMDVMHVPVETSHLAGGVSHHGIVMMQIAAVVMPPGAVVSAMGSGMSRLAT
jgi:hypothetical protein